MYGFPSLITPSRFNISKMAGHFRRAQVSYIMLNKSEQPNFEMRWGRAPKYPKCWYLKKQLCDIMGLQGP